MVLLSKNYSIYDRMIYKMIFKGFLDRLIALKQNIILLGGLVVR